MRGESWKVQEAKRGTKRGRVRHKKWKTEDEDELEDDYDFGARKKGPASECRFRRSRIYRAVVLAP